ncbi:MAG TPA: hypothetical protein PKY03_05345 [Moraxellaceae bacterium]|nr:hypothetical protein [Moraxellaceae bacterium]
MSKLSTLTPIAAVLAVSLAGVSHAAENPFATTSLSAGTTLAAHHDTSKDANKEEKTTTAADKEGRCGEGKCGSMKDKKPAAPVEKTEKTDKTDKASKEGKCGEGKCGTKTYGVN